MFDRVLLSLRAQFKNIFSRSSNLPFLFAFKQFHLLFYLIIFVVLYTITFQIFSSI